MDTVLHRFYENASKFGDSTCFMAKDKSTGSWVDISWSRVLNEVSSVGRMLLSLGVKKGDPIAIFSNTRYEWTIIDIAIMSVGAVTVPIYHTLSLNHVIYIINHSSAKVVFVEDCSLLQRLSENMEKLGSTLKIVLIDGVANSNDVICLLDVISAGASVGSGDVCREYEALIKDIVPEDLATCVYTSGTTGEPKGVELTHANINGEVIGLRHVFDFKRDEIGLLFLPLAHVVARAMQFYQISYGCISAYAESIDKLAQNMLEVRPHFVVVVPRVLEKIYEKIMGEVDLAPSFRKSVFRKSLDIGRNVSEQVRKHKNPSILTALKYRFVNKLVFSRVRARFGGRLRFLVSGGAPLDKMIAEFFHAMGLLVLEGYGLTETMAAVSINHPDDFKFGTVGKPLDGVQIHIAGDGEIMVKGEQVFSRYRTPAPDDDTFENGWFKTGDIGEFSRDGFLRITGRKKELIITASGKNISPQRVEEVIRSSPYIKDVVVYGDGRRYLCALIIPDYGYLKQFADGDTYELIKSEIECKNRQLARYETIKRFTIIDRDFSAEGGELTPTMKVRRHKVYQRYRDAIEKMYK